MPNTNLGTTASSFLVHPHSCRECDSLPVGLSVFFPAFNDAQSLPELLERTFRVIPQLTPDYEVIVINDGSTDDTASVLEDLANLYAPYLKIVTHETNRGYGAALRSGFAACAKDLVFYTDGDGQYDVRELVELWKKLRPGIDVVNGYKLARGDGWARAVIGNTYNRFVKWLFDLRIRDVDCDFRLIRRGVLDRIELHSDTGSICVELIKNLQIVTSGFDEAGVHHYPRRYGRSQFLHLKSVLATFYQLFMLYHAHNARPAWRRMGKLMSASAAAGMNPAELANIAANEQSHWWYRGMRSILRELISRHSLTKTHSRVLEAGCGTGYNSRWLTSQYRWTVVPVDIEASALRYVRIFELPNAAQADIRSLPFSDGTFDLVLSLDVLVHIPRGDESKCLAELFRVTKQGGLILLRTAAFDALRSRHSEFVDEKQRFTRSRLKQVAAQSGFRVLYCTCANSLLFPVALAKFRIWEPLMRKPPASAIAPVPDWLNRLLYLPLALEAKWIGAGLRLPVGQSVVLVGEKPGDQRISHRSS